MKKTVLAVTTFFSITAYSQDKSQNTIWPDGVNAAAYTDISVDRGTVLDRELSSLRLLAGFQLVRLWEAASISVGFGKVGFYDAVHDWDDGDEKFQFNYQGPTLGVELFPNFPINAEIVHFINPRGKGVEKISSELTSGLEEQGDYRMRYNFKIQDTTLYMGVRLWDQLRLMVGLGNRSIDWTYKVTRHDEDATVSGIERPTSGSETSQYILVGIRGTQLMN
ncbi:hypothetical protein [Pseudobacteriovorax antillogorgiicola]|uniref:Outer membrane protein beta-barrel domain-containing protein n=1 Tax=Pseudobacteriovorax antillogorgiicola TaxID=1513793 RepID=A0A1Y6BHL2_9BACT|nr:hypothetical protein [Pseudobacteriovorax antillogorgiicola]TCS55500.1 hypothetical protein EDD56_105222 [Pseudobacteriovorax antillogorgiicola]SMF11603.1 hypothetical protein SAMN06296036_105102 [Pseudobacteriovorax antillogorgiicola]